MLRYGFFDSEITGYDEEGMPIFDRGESSDFLAMFISHIISDGVLAQPSDSFQVLAYEGMKLKIRPGFCIIKGRFAFDEHDFYITVPAASSQYKRIDRVILRANYPQRLCEIMIIEGEPAADPLPPDLIQPTSGDYYELCLATIAVNSNQTVITQSNITDTRYDSSVCGIVTQVIDHIDTSVLFAQLNQFYNEFVAQSDSSYEQYVSDMEEYLEGLETFGNNQLEEILDDLRSWLGRMKDQLSEDAAGHLQVEIDELKEKLDEIETPDWDDTGEVEGIESFTDFMTSFVKNTSIYQLFTNLKAGLKYVLHAGQLVNNGLCEESGKFPLDAAYGHALTEQITQLNSDNGGLKLSYEDGNYYAQYGDDESTKKALGEIEKSKLIEALSASGLGLTLQSTPDQIYAALKEKFPEHEIRITVIHSPNVYHVRVVVIAGNAVISSTEYDWYNMTGKPAINIIDTINLGLYGSYHYSITAIKKVIIANNSSFTNILSRLNPNQSYNISVDDNVTYYIKTE